MLAPLPSTALHIYVSSRVLCMMNSCDPAMFHKSYHNVKYFSLWLWYVCIATACYNDSASQFPSNNMFAAAGDGIWDNGAACGRQYLVRCISAAVADSCIADQVIQVKIVDYALALINNPPSASGTTIVLSETAFGAIANNSAAPTSINLEFQQ
jgi:hypothetical protein